jgi:hypothetical protein
VRRLAAASLTVAVFAAVVAVRVAFAPIRWGLASLTEGPEEDGDGYVWWRDDVDRDLGWPELRVAENPEVSHNGFGSQHVGRN